MGTTWWALRVLVESVRAERGGQRVIGRYQARRLADLVEYARTRSPYYRRLYAGLPAGIAEPAALPPTSKPDLMAHFDEWVTDPAVTLEAIRRDLLAHPDLVGVAYLGRYHVFTTSGTTGEPAVLLQDAASWVVLNVVARLRSRHAVAVGTFARGVLRRGLRVAALYAGGGHFGAAVLVESMRRRAPVVARHVRLLSVLRPVPDLVAELDRFQPTSLSGYPSAMTVLAAEQAAGRLHLRPLVVFVAGERLTPSMRRQVEDAWRCPVVDSYAASEVPALAVPCRRGSLHVNTDWYLLEPVDEHGRPVPAGTTSYTTLVTNLANKVQPVIRYDLGDRVTLGRDRCACGSPFPTVTVQGRTNDVLLLPADDGGVVTLLPLAVETVVEEVAGVHRFQLGQTGTSTLVLRLEGEPGTDTAALREAVEAALLRFLATHGVTHVSVGHDPEPPRAETRSGKLRHVWSTVRQPATVPLRPPTTPTAAPRGAATTR
jgi:phenylacetate-coenzyme A ligase PaaK-like adenylate-forming protein